jgi:hypothetical protein
MQPREMLRDHSTHGISDDMRRCAHGLRQKFRDVTGHVGNAEGAIRRTRLPHAAIV